MEALIYTVKNEFIKKVIYKQMLYSMFCLFSI